MMARMHGRAGWLGVVLAALVSPAFANDATAPANSYGNVGLLQTPTARFAPEGTFRVGFSSDPRSEKSRAWSEFWFWAWLKSERADLSERPEVSRLTETSSLDTLRS